MEMFKKISELIEGKLAGPLEKLSNQRHLRAIRDGIKSEAKRS